MSTAVNRVKFVIHGEPASKANSRKLVTNRKTGRTLFIKSDKARKYVSDFELQCPKLSELILDDVRVTATIYYRTRRPDLDESVVLDCMQGCIYQNDRQVKEKHIYWALDAESPRAEILVETIAT